MRENKVSTIFEFLNDVIVAHYIKTVNNVKIY